MNKKYIILAISGAILFSVFSCLIVFNKQSDKIIQLDGNIDSSSSGIDVISDHRRLPKNAGSGRPVPTRSLVDSRAQILEMGKTDITNAIRRAEAVDDENLRANLLGEIADIWAKTDAEACFSWAKTLANPNEKSSALVGMSLSLIRDGKIYDAIKFIGLMPKGEFKDDMIVYGLSGIAKDDVSNACQLALQLSGKGAVDAASRKIADQLIENSNLAEARQLLDEMPQGAFRESISLSIISALSKSDPKMAFYWFKDNPGYSNTESLGLIANAFSVKDPILGLEMGNLINNIQEKQIYLTKLGMGWGRNDPLASSDWMMQQIQDGKYSSSKNICEGILTQAIQWDHDKVLKRIEMIENKDDKTSLTLQAAKSLSKFDPQSAAIMVKNFQNQPTNESIATVTKITANWLEKDPISASEWVGSLSGGPVKDSAVSELILNIIKSDQDIGIARKWAEQIGAQDQRNLAISRIDELERKKH